MSSSDEQIAAIRKYITDEDTWDYYGVLDPISDILGIPTEVRPPEYPVVPAEGK